jgi:hypothetical protein
LEPTGTFFTARTVPARLQGGSARWGERQLTEQQRTYRLSIMVRSHREKLKNDAI